MGTEMSYDKRAAMFLPTDLQAAVNTFIEQFNIIPDNTKPPNLHTWFLTKTNHQSAAIVCT